MKELKTTSLGAGDAKTHPDVIVARAEQTALFKMRNRTVSEWMREHYHSTTGDVKGNTEVCVHPTRCKRIIEELRAAGFTIQSF
ncbi:MAG TPA: hypothetical protein VGY56_14510 [Verrucomicrobiae bacterium]|nr:hypothetical protein [Verrucomicrobiae bacterium]